MSPPFVAFFAQTGRKLRVDLWAVWAVDKARPMKSRRSLNVWLGLAAAIGTACAGALFFVATYRKPVDGSLVHKLAECKTRQDVEALFGPAHSIDVPRRAPGMVPRTHLSWDADMGVIEVFFTADGRMVGAHCYTYAYDRRWQNRMLQRLGIR